MEKRNLKDEFEKIANAYLEAFCKKHGLNYEEAKCGWVANEVGDVVCVSEYYINFDEIRLDIDKDVDKDEYYKYYDYCVEAAEYGCTVPNYRSWLAGCPRLSDKQLDEIRKAHKASEKARMELERLIEEEQEKIGYCNSNPF